MYRKYGHNEGDDPSYTQPLMYQRIDAKRSVRKLYTETLVRRGDITLEGRSPPSTTSTTACRPCSTRCAVSPPWHRPTSPPDRGDTDIPSAQTGVAADVLRPWPTLVRSVPDGFTIHPKLERQFSQRDQMVAGGEVDWALAEASPSARCCTRASTSV